MKKQAGKINIEKLLGQQTEVILSAVSEKQQETNSKVHKVGAKVDKVYNKLDKYLEMYSKTGSRI